MPGLMFAHIIKRKRQEYEAFLARLESFTVQHFKKRFDQAQKNELHPDFTATPNNETALIAASA